MNKATGQEGSAECGPAKPASPADVLDAYLNQSSSIQGLIRDLVHNLKHLDLSPEERERTEIALRVSLSYKPSPASHERGRILSREEREQMVPGLREVRQEMEERERVFVANLTRLLKEKGFSEAELAVCVGLGQEAITMMMARKYRPQRRTIRKLAEVLGVSVEELWPGFGEGWRSGVM